MNNSYFGRMKIFKGREQLSGQTFSDLQSAETLVHKFMQGIAINKVHDKEHSFLAIVKESFMHSDDVGMIQLL